ncbi:MAG: response regulator [candidate division KSB1 bacterium]|nr:response regulator [candidate division KSB1 bacterium]
MIKLIGELVRLHGGEISVQNENGKDACFLVRLPAGENLFHDYRAPTVASRDQLFKTEIRSEESLPDKQDSEKPTILIVEDDSRLRENLRDKLSECYRVLTEASGKSGLKTALGKVPDLVISDIMIPEIDGIELCKRIKANPLSSHIPVVLLTNHGSDLQQLECLESGADDYLAKPFNLDILKMRIRNLILYRERLRERFRREAQLMTQNIIGTSSSDEQFLKCAINAVEAHLSDQDFDVQSFSHALGVSRAQLFRKLKALTSETPVRFIQTIRLQRAAQLLIESQLSVSQICYEVGFNYPSYFAELFHSQFGVSPKEYRKQNRR